MNIYIVPTETSAWCLGLICEYGVGLKKASVSIWRPRLAPDSQNKEGVILKWLCFKNHTATIHKIFCVYRLLVPL